jgi:competence/damage-inducible protein CinA-like protein
MATAEIITIGTEILLGEIVDTNARSIARNLRDIGVDLYRKTSVGDNASRIAQAIQQALERCDIIITTGGLGPTVDDPTREAVALAMGVEMEFRPELWDQIQARFKRFNRQPTENNKRQAYVPCNATAVENPVGTAPAFIVETGNHAIISLPGVPREMEYLMENAILPYLRKRYHLHGIIKTRLLHTAGAGESQIDDLIGDLETHSNPTVGLAAHSGQVDVRITAKAGSEAEADNLIAPLEKIIRERLGEWIYGSDQETLEQMALQHLADLGWSLGVVVDTHCSEIIQRLAGIGQPFQGGEVLAISPTPEELQAVTTDYRQKRETDVALGLALYPGQETQDIHVAVVTPVGVQSFTRPYGGPPKYGPHWAINHSLDIIRNL